MGDSKDERFTLCGPTEETSEDLNTLSEYLLACAGNQAGRGKTKFAIDSITGESFEFSQFEKLSRNVASALYKRGVRKGDIIVYLSLDLVKLHIFFTGVWLANAAVRSTYVEELADSITQVTVESKSKWILCESSDIEKCIQVAKNVGWPVEIIVMGKVPEGCTSHSSISSIYDLLEDDGSACPAIEVGPNDPALILATSGTTGRSKGAVHTHKALIDTSRKLTAICPLVEGKPNLCISKGTHISAATFGLLTMVTGNTALYMSRITLDNIISAVEKYKPGCIVGFPTFLLALVNDPRLQNLDKSFVESVMTTGTTIHPSVETTLRDKLPCLKTFSIIYALTEIAPVTATSIKQSTGDDVVATKISGTPSFSIGKPVPGAKMQIRDSNSGEILGPNQHGELCIKSDNLFSFYLHQEEETKKAFSDDGWFLTGDTGYYDENGFVFLIGRYKEMFKCGGNHVYPAQIDEVISRHPAVANVCTVGIPEGTEKIPRAFAVLKPGSKASAQDILQFSNDNLPSYKQLTGGLHIVPDLPKGATGKVTRRLVEQLSIDLKLN